jgi:hypothetical protein
LDPAFAGTVVPALVVPAFVVPATAELLLELALTIPYVPPATAMAELPMAMDLMSFRESMRAS